MSINTAGAAKPCARSMPEDERLKFENDKEHYAPEVQNIYDETPTYHDGKWLMFEPVDTSLFEDFIRLLTIKRKPNRK